MKAIWKYRIPLVSESKVSMQKDARIIHVNIQEESLTIWAIVETESIREFRTFRVFGTGEELDEKYLPSLIYIGTVHIKGYVFHIFEKVI